MLICIYHHTKSFSFGGFSMIFDIYYQMRKFTLEVEKTITKNFCTFYTFELLLSPL
jgi:hypothetical protein